MALVIGVLCYEKKRMRYRKFATDCKSRAACTSELHGVVTHFHKTFSILIQYGMKKL